MLPTETVLQPNPRVLVVDDDAALAETIADGLCRRGYSAVPVVSSQDASRRLHEEQVDALVTDLRMPHTDGLGLLAVSKRTSPSRPVILMTAFSAVDSAVESLRQGAYHYLTKPFKVDELALFLGRALEEARVRQEAAVLRKALRDLGHVVEKLDVDFKTLSRLLEAEAGEEAKAR
jgi:two-component system response regulator HydG